MPNQPLYERTEDDLIAYTFERYLVTGDETWPLLLPMTKSRHAGHERFAGMVGEKTAKPKSDRFIISGASKRGWTTDLVAAVDKRVVGHRADCLRQFELEPTNSASKRNLGQTSDMTGAYNDIGLFEAMQTPVGQKLVGIVDPYAYKSRLTVPKLFVHATNDQYWSHDSARFYWSDLPGQNRLFEVPNAPHTLGKRLRGRGRKRGGVGQIDIGEQSRADVALSRGERKRRA